MNGPAAPGAVAARMPPQAPRAVIFDMDGLMLDTERLDRGLWQAAARRRGLDISDALYARLVGRRALDSERVLQEHFGPGLALDDIRAEVLAHWRVHASSGLPRKAGLEPLLGTLERARIPLAVATSTARAKALVSLGPLARHFQALACGDEVVHGKPAPDIFLLAAQRLGFAPGECLALEDSPAGVAAAVAARMPVIMIPDLVQPSCPVQYLCGSLVEVAQWFQWRLAA